MKTLLLSDIHGNYEALKQILKQEKYDNLIFLGDAVDYGPQPAEVLDFLKSESDHNLMGNHDYAVAFDEDCHCALAMHHLSEFTREKISKKVLGKEDIDLLKTFKKRDEFEIDGMKVLAMHASPYNDLFGYLFSTEAEMVSKDPELKKYDLIMVGHTHFPMIYKSRIINPGSAGQPRDGISSPWYAIMETDPFQLSFRRFRYDSAKTLSLLGNLVGKDSDEFSELRKFYS